MPSSSGMCFNSGRVSELEAGSQEKITIAKKTKIVFDEVIVNLN